MNSKRLWKQIKESIEQSVVAFLVILLLMVILYFLDATKLLIDIAVVVSIAIVLFVMIDPLEIRERIRKK